MRTTWMRHPRPWIVSILIALTVCAAAPASGDDGRLAEVRLSEKGIVFEPLVDFERLVLTVSGPDVRLEREFSKRPVIDLRELADGRSRDGRYTYELRRVPKIDPDLRRRLERLRQSGDDKEIAELRRRGVLPGGPFVQTGSFTIVEGRLVDPGAEEKGGGRDPRLEGSLSIAGDLEVEGAKRFRARDAAGAGRDILFTALEGPEAGTYFRGSARLEAGEAVVELPEVFTLVTEADGLTVQLTPVGGWSRLYVAELTRERLVVRAADGADDGRFDFLVQGVRLGYAEDDADRP